MHNSFGNMVKQIRCCTLLLLVLLSICVSAGPGWAEHPHWRCSIKSNSIPESVSLAHKHTQCALLQIHVMLMFMTQERNLLVWPSYFKALKSTSLVCGERLTFARTKPKKKVTKSSWSKVYGLNMCGVLGLSVSHATQGAWIPSGRRASGTLGRPSRETSVVLLTDFTWPDWAVILLHMLQSPRRCPEGDHLLHLKLPNP